MDRQAHATVRAGCPNVAVVPPSTHAIDGDSLVLMPIQDYGGLAAVRDILSGPSPPIGSLVQMLTELLPLAPPSLPQTPGSVHCVACGRIITTGGSLVRTLAGKYWVVCDTCYTPVATGRDPNIVRECEAGKVKLSDGMVYPVETQSRMGPVTVVAEYF